MKRLFLAAVSLALSACSTVHQSIVTPKAPAPLGYVAPLKDESGYRLTKADRDRYNGLIAIYGSAKFADGAPVFVPALKKDAGITKADDPTYPFHMTFAARIDFYELTVMKDMAFPVR